MTHITERERVVALAGAYNFRDIGGYPAAAGSHVVWGKVYRAASLARLTDADHTIIDGLGLRVICDLRSSTERRHRPSRLAEGSGVESWSRDHETSAAELVNAMGRPGMTAIQSRQMMIDIYRTLAYEQADSYRELFGRIASGDLPILFHCSAGKDRTGIATALLLDLLGVARETIIEDYVFTDRFFAMGCKLIMDEPSSRRLQHVDPAIWEPMMRADRAYIEMMIETVVSRHGSGAGFVRDVLGIEDAGIARIRERLLVGAPATGSRESRHPSGDMVSPPSTNNSDPVM